MRSFGKTLSGWRTVLAAAVCGTVLAAAVCLWLGLSGAGAPAAAQTPAPKVVVTIKPIHALVSEIMAGVGEPSLLVDGSASPHTFTLRPSAARAVNEADIFIRVSEHLEPFTRKIGAALPASVKMVTLDDARGIKHLSQRTGGTFEPHRHDEKEAGEGSAHDDHDDDKEAEGAHDPHIWLDPENAKAIVTDVTAVLSDRYPGSSATFQANAAGIQKQLAELSTELAGHLAPLKNRPFVIFHDATQYFERRFGLEAVGSITLSPDVPPSARRLSELRTKIKSLGAVCVFAEPNFQPNLVAAVTEGTDAKSGTLDAEGQMLKPAPDLYFTLMRGMAAGLADCLESFRSR